MCKAIEEYGNTRAEESVRESTLKTALRMLGLGKYEDEEIALITGLELEEIKGLKVQNA